VTQADYQTVIAVCISVILLLSPFAGIHRALRRLRAKSESAVAPVLAACIVVADAIAGLAELLHQRVALLAVILAAVWLAAALAANGLVRRAKSKAAKGLPGADAP